MAIGTQVSQELERKMTCITCPTGCQLEVTRNADGELSITGAQCRRGEVYARNEILDPRRVLTTTVRIRNGACRSCLSGPQRLFPKSWSMPCASWQGGSNCLVRTGDVILPNIWIRG